MRVPIEWTEIRSRLPCEWFLLEDHKRTRYRNPVPRSYGHCESLVKPSESSNRVFPPEYIRCNARYSYQQEVDSVSSAEGEDGVHCFLSSYKLPCQLGHAGRVCLQSQQQQQSDNIFKKTTDWQAKVWKEKTRDENGTVTPMSQSQNYKEIYANAQAACGNWSEQNSFFFSPQEQSVWARLWGNEGLQSDWTPLIIPLPADISVQIKHRGFTRRSLSLAV